MKFCHSDLHFSTLAIVVTATEVQVEQELDKSEQKTE